MKSYVLICLVCLGYFLFWWLMYSKKKQYWAMTLDGKNSVLQPKCVIGFLPQKQQTKQFFTRPQNQESSVISPHVTACTWRIWLISRPSIYKRCQYYPVTYTTHLSSLSRFFIFELNRSRNTAWKLLNGSHRVTIWSSNSTIRYRYKKSGNTFT